LAVRCTARCTARAERFGPMPHAGILHIATPSEREVVLTRDFASERRSNGMTGTLVRRLRRRRWPSRVGRRS